MKTSLLLLFFIFVGCQKKETYGDHHYLNPDKAVYGKLSMTIDGKKYSRTILDKDSIRRFIEDLNNSVLIDSFDQSNPKKTDGHIALVMKDTFVIRLNLTDNKISIPRIHTKYYELNKKYAHLIKQKNNLPQSPIKSIIMRSFF